jgi:hypothetical protein
MELISKKQKAAIIIEFSRCVDDAFMGYKNDIYSMGRSARGNPMFPENDEDVFDGLNRKSGRLGALIGAAVKRAKRDAVFLGLSVAVKRDGADLTYHAVQNSAKRLIGRGFKKDLVLSTFSTAGRTAARKTTTDADDLKEVERQISAVLTELIPMLGATKLQKRKEWKDSAARKEIMKDWSLQRKESKLNQAMPFLNI